MFFFLRFCLSDVNARNASRVKVCFTLSCASIKIYIRSRQKLMLLWGNIFHIYFDGFDALAEKWHRRAFALYIYIKPIHNFPFINKYRLSLN